MSKSKSPRTIDHLVLPVANIDIARERYTRLGFNVAPDGVHPFGTENCCVFFKDGTFLEPLGIHQRETCEAEARDGHVFVRNDQTYRFRRGIEGFSHLVLKSDDAQADHELYVSLGMSDGKKGHFARDFETPDGQKGSVAFNLAFAADPRSPDAKFFTCEVANAPNVDRTALQQHNNGVTGISEVILSEVNPTDFQYFFQTFLNQREMDVDSFGMSFDASKGKVTVLSPAGMSAFHKLDVENQERGMLFQAFVLAVSDLSKTKAYFDKNSVSYAKHAGRLVVPPSEGQGTVIMFEEEA